MAFLSKILGRQPDRRQLQPLYAAIVATARAPDWYLTGQVPDTLDGRFDMIAALLALVLLRLEAEPGPQSERASVLLTETFVDDMDGSLRQLGIGDLLVGKHVGRMMGALGGRLAAFREAGAEGLTAAAAPNIFHDAPPSPAALAFVAAELEAFRARLRTMTTDAILTGTLP